MKMYRFSTKYRQSASKYPSATVLQSAERQVRNATIFLPYTVAAMFTIEHEHQAIGLRNDRIPTRFEGWVTCAVINALLAVRSLSFAHFKPHATAHSSK